MPCVLLIVRKTERQKLKKVASPVKEYHAKNRMQTTAVEQAQRARGFGEHQGWQAMRASGASSEAPVRTGAHGLSRKGIAGLEGDRYSLVRKMIIHKLLLRYFKHRDDSDFYLMQAEDAIRWLVNSGISLTPETRALDLGCGHGVFGRELKKRGCQVTFADQANYLYPELKSSPFKPVDIDNDNLSTLGEYDLVICSNVFEHLARPDKFLAQCTSMLAKNGRLYLSWTNWLSPFGGHDYALYHYFGPRFGRWMKFKLTGKWSFHVPYAGLYPTYIGPTIRKLKQSPTVKILKMASRYYTEFSFVVRIPLLREFLAWNCALLIANPQKDKS